MTIEALNSWGARTDEGLARCFGNPDFYLRLVGMAKEDKNLAALEAALDARDLDAAFEACHALKGVLANLALTPLLQPVSEMTELLRARTDTDYSPLLAQVKARWAEFISL